MANRIGVIADTHGRLHPRIPELFAGVDHILHAGDIGGAAILEELERIAPVTAVAGNNDDASGYEIRRVRIGGLRVLLTHILPRPSDPDPRVIESLKEEPADIVVFGHSHLPHDEIRDGQWFFNPASAGPRRFDLPVSAGLLKRRGRGWHGLHIGLDERSVASLQQTMNRLSGGFGTSAPETRPAQKLSTPRAYNRLK